MNKRTIILAAFIGLWSTMFVGCMNKGKARGYNDTICGHDTISIMPEGEFVNNLPCKVVNIHQRKKGSLYRLSGCMVV
jgi:hypothetical protein